MATPETTTSVEHVPAGEQGAGFPPFDAQTFPSQLLWLAITFVGLYLLMSRVGLPRVASILQARQDKVASDIAEAERHRDESEAARLAYEKSLADARSRAQALAAEARQRQIAKAEAARLALEERLNAQIGEAEQTIATSRQAAMRNVQDIATGAASEIVARLIGTAPPDKAVADAVAAVLKR